MNMQNKLPSISVVIPCRNEKEFIGRVLDSVIANDYPKSKLELLVVDGMSEDGTRETVEKYVKEYSFVRLLDNIKKIVPNAMNIGIKNAKGDIIVRMDAHAEYPKDYISKTLYWLEKSGADNVGGIWITKPGANTLIAEAIALSLSSSFGVGNAMFRIGLKKPKYVDTVPFGCYKRDVFDKVGFFDEDLVRNQDDEFNLRLIKNGGKILLCPDIVSHYYARDSLKKLWKMYFQYGYFKPLVAIKVGAVLTWRQLIPPLFVGFLVTTGLLSFLNKSFLWFFLFVISLYTVTNFFFSLSISTNKKEFRLLPFLIVSFATLHFSYGLGYLKGIWNFLICKKHLKKKIKDIPLTR